MKTNILITTIGRRVTLTKIFKKELNRLGGKLIVSDHSPLAPALYQADGYYLTPRVDAPDYLATLLKICRTENIKVIIPLLETAFPLLAEQRIKLEKAGIYLLLSDLAVIKTCQDKYKLYQYFKNNQLPTPLTFLPGQLKKHKFPLLIKPRCGQGSQQVFKLNNQKEYDFFSTYIEDPIIQEYIEGTEFTIDTVSDLAGRLLAAVPRKRIEVRGGEVSKAVTVKEERLINWTKEIMEGMKMSGPANLQAIITPGDEIKFIELNPRFGGGVPLSYQAGVNYPKIIISLIKEEEVKPFLGEFEDGLAMLRYDRPLFKKIGV